MDIEIIGTKYVKIGDRMLPAINACNTGRDEYYFELPLENGVLYAVDVCRDGNVEGTKFFHWDEVARGECDDCSRHEFSCNSLEEFMEEVNSEVTLYRWQMDNNFRTLLATA
jgi:hypothetical protein